MRTRAAQATTIILFALVRSIQSRWELWHTIRTFASIAAVVTVTISAVVTGRPEEPRVEAVGPQGGAVAGDRSA